MEKSTKQLSCRWFGKHTVQVVDLYRLPTDRWSVLCSVWYGSCLSTSELTGISTVNNDMMSKWFKVEILLCNEK